MKGFGSQRVSERACGLLGCNNSPVILRGLRDALSSAASGLTGATAVERAAALVFLRRCLCGPGFPQAQLRPDLPSLLLDRLKI